VWNKQKKTEKERVSILDGIAEILPALLKAFQIGQRVSAYGFDWDQPSGALQKVREELDELEQAIQSKKGINLSDEMGDCLFSLVNVSRQLHVNPEIALRQTNDKFIKRFRYIEDKLREKDRDLEKVSLEEMEALWEESKGKVDSPQK
jgi:MazG family protein